MILKSIVKLRISNDTHIYIVTFLTNLTPISNTKNNDMSFGGAVSAMVTSLKNNKRDRKSALKKLKENGEYSQKTELHFDKLASPSQLREIRERIQKENKTRARKKIIVLIVICIILIYFVGFF